MKKLIRLSESDLHRIVKESVTQILNESIRIVYDMDKDLGFNTYKMAKDLLKTGEIRHKFILNKSICLLEIKLDGDYIYSKIKDLTFGTIKYRKDYGEKFEHVDILYIPMVEIISKIVNQLFPSVVLKYQYP